MTNLLENKIIEQAKLAKQSSRRLAHLDTAYKDKILLQMAEALIAQQENILAANAQDLVLAKQQGLSSALCDRLKLTKDRIHSMAEALKEIAALPDPVERELGCDQLNNGLMIHKVSVPIGVLAFIYESRPNVTTDAIGLALKSGNAIILKGGKEALGTNRVIFHSVMQAFKEVIDDPILFNAIQFIDSSERQATYTLLAQKDYLDLVIPRGSESLIRAVMEHTDVPVLQHLDGICHVYVDAGADPLMAQNIIINAKCQRPGVCNAMETLLLHAEFAQDYLANIAKALHAQGVELHGCEKTQALLKDIIPVLAATEEDWRTEYLAPILSIKIVENTEEAVEHINHYGSHHSDSIITQNAKQAEYFLHYVDSAVVYHNASTRFTDGSVFGMGAEMGISTGKLQARGPVGLNELTIYQYRVMGNGQIR